MHIRNINENDLEGLLALYSHLHEGDAEPIKEKITMSWKTIIRNPNIFIYLVAEKEDKLVGTCNITIIPNLTRGGRSIGLIENVVTHSDFRNQGIGRQLIEHALDIGRKRNCYKVMLMTSVKRKEAHQFYEKIGFNSSDKKAFVKTFSNENVKA